MVSREDLLKVRSSLEKDPSEEVRRQVECVEPERNRGELRSAEHVAAHQGEECSQRTLGRGGRKDEGQSHDVRLEEAADPGN